MVETVGASPVKRGKRAGRVPERQLGDRRMIPLGERRKREDAEAAAYLAELDDVGLELSEVPGGEASSSSIDPAVATLPSSPKGGKKSSSSASSLSSEQSYDVSEEEEVEDTGDWPEASTAQTINKEPPSLRGGGTTTSWPSTVNSEATVVD